MYKLGHSQRSDRKGGRGKGEEEVGGWRWRRDSLNDTGIGCQIPEGD